jgi:23S rRNA (uridine2552-2'-O)-methyltransferase
MPKGGGRKKDHYARKAHSAGYQARSVYKLDEIQKRYGLVPGGAVVLDLGAAPGSWTQRLLEIVGGRGRVTACDLKALDISDPRLTAIEGDFTEPETIERIRRLGPYDVVVSDAAPATTGNRTVDTARSEALVESAVDTAHRVLKPGGNVALKIFQGGAEQRLRQEMRSSFRKVGQTKPAASRKESFEVYLIGVDYKGEGESDAATRDERE